MAEAALLRAARSLDQSGPETVASKLQRLWEALAATSSSSSSSTVSGTSRFHASEEVALRWLLKNMHASVSGPAGPEIETLRRWPLTWHILACIFGRIPLFSLAKSLADRRFFAILQQTAKDLATPATTAVDGQSSRKRKRWQDAQFDLASLREPQHCVVLASALFDALRVLLSRLDDNNVGNAAAPASLASPFDHMGAEHIKSFFSVPAAESTVLLVPLLKTCRLALSTDGILDARDAEEASDNGKSNTTSILEGKASWISTFTTLWDLRLQGPNDAFEVSGLLALDGLTMLGRLLNLSPISSAETESSLDPELQRRWSAGLRRFLTNNLVLPARSLYLNKMDTNALSMATSNTTAKTDVDGYIMRISAFLYLALKVPQVLSGSGTSGKDNEQWLQTVFEVIRSQLMAQNAVPLQYKNTTLAGLLDMVSVNKISPRIDSLQEICQKCAISSDQSTVYWRLLASVAQCNADTFLLSEKGAALLNSVLPRLGLPGAEPMSPTDTQFASSFLISLSRGFAKNRDLSRFVTLWCTGIDGLFSDISRSSMAMESAWLGKGLRDAFAEILRSFSDEEQLLSMIAQTKERTDVSASSSDDNTNATSRTVARIVIFDALSASVYDDVLEDAVQTEILDSILGLELSSDLAPSILAIWWRIVRRNLAWVGFSDAERVWSTAAASLKSLSAGGSKKTTSSMLSEDKFEAFICSFSLWMSLKFDGQAEQEARETTWAFFGRFQEELTALVNGKGGQKQAELLQEVVRQTSADSDAAKSFGGSFDSKTSTAAAYLVWMLCVSSRFIDEMTKSSEEPSKFLEDLLSWQSSLRAGDGVAAASSLLAMVFSNATSLQNQRVTSSLAETQVQRLESAATSKSPSYHGAALALLQTPSHLLSRTQRERIVSALLPPRPTSEKTTASLTADDAVLALDLLTKVTRERAFGDVDFDRLVYLGESMQAAVDSEASESALSIFDRLQQVAKAVMKSSAGKSESAIPKSIPLSIQLVLYAAKLSALKVASSSTIDSAHVLQTKEKLSAIVVKQLLAHLENKEDVEMSGTVDVAEKKSNHLPVQLLLVFDAAMADDIQPQLAQQKKFNSLVKKAKKTAEMLCADQQKIGWKWKALLARYARGQESRPIRDVLFQGLFLDSKYEDKAAADATSDTASYTPTALLSDNDLLRDYLSGETAGYDQDALLSYIEDVVDAFSLKKAEGASTVGQLLAIQHLLARLFETTGAASAKTASGFHLGVVHSKLTQRLAHTDSVTECRLVAQTLKTLLVDDKAAAAMGQWNIDTTLSAATAVVSNARDGNGSNGAVWSSVTAYDSACQLVEAVLKRHRVRLEGRFHLLVSTLQALLGRLASGHQEELKQRSTSISSNGAVPSSTATASWTQKAKRFSRLLELICEPSTAAVTMMTFRKGGANNNLPTAPLHSATDAAKRSAGQHMYLVLMTYIKLEDGGLALAHSVRDALEPGLFSILAITPEETRQLLNAAVDVNGQTIFKTLHRRWLQVGKWKGV